MNSTLRDVLSSQTVSPRLEGKHTLKRGLYFDHYHPLILHNQFFSKNPRERNIEQIGFQMGSGESNYHRSWVTGRKVVWGKRGRAGSRAARSNERTLVQNTRGDLRTGPTQKHCGSVFTLFLNKKKETYILNVGMILSKSLTASDSFHLPIKGGEISENSSSFPMR